MIRRDFLTLGVASLASAAAPTTGALGGPSAAVALAPVTARTADEVCQSYMVNTKLFYKDTVYGHTDAVLDLLDDLGVRIVRERVTTGTSIGTRNQQRAMIELARRGVRWHATVGELEDYVDANAVNRNVMHHFATYYKPRVGGNLANLLHSFGGCNEIDGPVFNGHNDPEWALHARIMQRALWAAAKADPATRNIPVAGPSTRTDVTAQRAAELGDLSEYCDMGNGHLYNRGTSPTRYLDEHLAVLRRCFPDVTRWVMSESGYNNSQADNLGKTVPEAASATYAIRAICDFFRRRAVWGRFELLDDPDAVDYSSQAAINRTSERDAHFGLVAMTRTTTGAATPDTWRKKPEYYATKRFLALMADQGPAFRPDPFPIEVSGGGQDLQRAFVQKRDGRHYLLLWRDVEVARVYPYGDRISVREQDLTVRLGVARPIAVHSPRWSDSPVRRYSARTSVRVPVAGDLTVVEIG
ncbi:MAG: hypothetical protein H0U77_02930 [Nocardioidaceae bacterium]|nr:hypothetical protein [Nocardioidaceae bacterium]